MLNSIDGLLNDTELGQVRRILDGASFVSGAGSAGKQAAAVKHNEELPLGAAETEQLNRIVMGNLVRHPVYLTAALPLKVASPYYSRYTRGMAYGPHVDDPVMGQGPRYRSDVAVTVFLNAPTEYEGGALCIETPYGDQSVKLEAGSAVLYPASFVHRVENVTSGIRLAAVTWIQSLVRDAARRDLLYQLAQARDSLSQVAPAERAKSLIDQVYVNLVRMWGDT